MSGMVYTTYSRCCAYCIYWTGSRELVPMLNQVRTNNFPSQADCGKNPGYTQMSENAYCADFVPIYR